MCWREFRVGVVIGQGVGGGANPGSETLLKGAAHVPRQRVPPATREVRTNRRAHTWRNTAEGCNFDPGDPQRGPLRSRQQGNRSWHGGGLPPTCSLGPKSRVCVTETECLAMATVRWQWCVVKWYVVRGKCHLRGKWCLANGTRHIVCGIWHLASGSGK